MILLPMMHGIINCLTHYFTLRVLDIFLIMTTASRSFRLVISHAAKVAL